MNRISQPDSAGSFTVVSSPMGSNDNSCNSVNAMLATVSVFKELVIFTLVVSELCRSSLTSISHRPIECVSTQS